MKEGQDNRSQSVPPGDSRDNEGEGVQVETQDVEKTSEAAPSVVGNFDEGKDERPQSAPADNAQYRKVQEVQAEIHHSQSPPCNIYDGNSEGTQLLNVLGIEGHIHDHLVQYCRCM